MIASGKVVRGFHQVLGVSATTCLNESIVNVWQMNPAHMLEHPITVRSLTDALDEHDAFC